MYGQAARVNGKQLDNLSLLGTVAVKSFIYEQLKPCLEIAQAVNCLLFLQLHWQNYIHKD